MIRKLDTEVEGPINRSVEVCIIGAGTAGLFLAQRLRKRGVRVAVLEIGDSEPKESKTIGAHVEQRGIEYRGATKGRSFGIGGTSVLWGGQMIALTEDDISERPEVGIPTWPISFVELEQQFATVRADLSLPGEQTDDLRVRGVKGIDELRSFAPEFRLRFSEWIPFAQRNFAQAFSKELKNDDSLEVWLGARVETLHFARAADGLRIMSVEAKGKNAANLLVEADAVVICAGALESTRMLLELDEATGGIVTRDGAPLGAFFSDHLSVTVGTFECRDWTRFNHAVAPVFEGEIMRTPRLEVSASTQRELGLTSAFAHFTFLTDGTSGFDVVRDFLRNRQGEKRRLGLSPGKALGAARSVAELGYWKTVHRRLWIPRDSTLNLQIDIEQTPNPLSRISLSNQKPDANGKRPLVIDWRISNDDVRIIEKTVEILKSRWESSDLNRAAGLNLKEPEAYKSFETLYDVYHPTGTIRMGSDRRKSVVDANLRVWGLRNLFVSSTAVFPSAGSANPGFTHLALTGRLAEHLAGTVSKNSASSSPKA